MPANRHAATDWFSVGVLKTIVPDKCAEMHAYLKPSDPCRAALLKAQQQPVPGPTPLLWVTCKHLLATSPIRPCHCLLPKVCLMGWVGYGEYVVSRGGQGGSGLLPPRTARAPVGPPARLPAAGATNGLCKPPPIPGIQRKRPPLPRRACPSIAFRAHFDFSSRKIEVDQKCNKTSGAQWLGIHGLPPPYK